MKNQADNNGIMMAMMSAIQGQSETGGGSENTGLSIAHGFRQSSEAMAINSKTAISAETTSFCRNQALANHCAGRLLEELQPLLSLVQNEG